jgi:hypothetical protein
MFDSRSRYANIEAAEYISSEGRRIMYKRRRFLPKGDELSLLVEVTVAQGDRLDLIANRILGDPEHFWSICDANDAMNPHHLTEDLGRILRIPVPEI